MATGGWGVHTPVEPQAPEASQAPEHSMPNILPSEASEESQVHEAPEAQQPVPEHSMPNILPAEAPEEFQVPEAPEAQHQVPEHSMPNILAADWDVFFERETETARV